MIVSLRLSSTGVLQVIQARLDRRESMAPAPTIRTAAEVTVSTTNFGHNLSSTDTTVQAGAGHPRRYATPFRGEWVTGTYPAGDIVSRSGIDYISLVNDNTEVPRPSAENWSGLPEGFAYRGSAPTVSSNYNYGHLVFDPDTDSYWVFTSTTSAFVARADIPTHPNFHELSHFLTNAEATDDTDDTHGTVSGRLLSNAINANDRVCPDPSTGTDGQVCATDGTAYELVDGGGALDLSTLPDFGEHYRDRHVGRGDVGTRWPGGSTSGRVWPIDTVSDYPPGRWSPSCAIP